MRKLLSAGVLALAAASAAILPATSAVASPAPETEWVLVEDYFHLVDCEDAGNAGLEVGEWSRFRCEWVGVPGEWDLYANLNDGPGDDDDDHNGGYGG